MRFYLHREDWCLGGPVPDPSMWPRWIFQAEEYSRLAVEALAEIRQASFRARSQVAAARAAALRAMAQSQELLAEADRVLARR